MYGEKNIVKNVWMPSDESKAVSELKTLCNEI